MSSREAGIETGEPWNCVREKKVEEDVLLFNLFRLNGVAFRIDGVYILLVDQKQYATQ